MKNSTFLLAPLALISLPTPVPAASPQRVVEASVYTVRLNAAEPGQAQFAMRVPLDALVLEAPPASVSAMEAPPNCGGAPLAAVSAHVWRKPVGCQLVTWSASMPSSEDHVLDASRPISMWSARRQLWFVTGDLPWLRYRDQPDAPVRIVASLAGKSVVEESRLPRARDIPVYIAIGAPVRSDVSGSVRVDAYGNVPRGRRYDRLQRQIPAILARWRRDILPDSAHGRSHFRYLWLDEAAGAQPGFFASTGSDAIVMQFVPDPHVSDPMAKLEAAIVLTGAHEGFHALVGSVSAGKPAWVNESWASYFSYAAAQRVLRGSALTAAKGLFDAQASLPVLRAQAMLDAGDGSAYEVFYAGGAWFWAAIDVALVTRPNGSGRLAALIQQTSGMAGVDWRDPRSISDFLDRHTAGRASAIVQCHLIESRCSERLSPPGR